MFEELISLVSQLNNNNKLQPKFYEPSEIAKFDHDQYEKIFCDITNQTKFEIYAHNNFTYNNTTKQIYESEHNIKNTFPTSTPFLFDEFEDYTIMEIILDDNLINYLYENIKCNYVALPIYKYSHAIKKTGHITLLLFDNINKKCFNIDSNGKDEIYDFFFKEKINYLQNFGLVYEYQENRKWNKHHIKLNMNYENDELNNNGNCVVWTILILHIISVMLLDPGEIYKKISLMHRDEKVYVLKEYAKLITTKYKYNEHDSTN